MNEILMVVNSVIQTSIMIFYFNGFINKKKNSKLTYTVFGVAFLIGIIKCIVPIPSTVNLILSISIAVIVVCLNYKDSKGKKIFSVLLYIILMMASEIISSDIISGVLKITYSEVPTLEREQMALLSNFLSFIMIVYIIKVPSGKIKNIPVRSWITIILMPIFSFCMLLIFDILTVESRLPYININVCNAFIILCFLYLNIAVLDFFDSYSAKLELKNAEIIMKNNNENYKILSQNENEMRMLKHDMKKHINIVRTMLASGNLENAEKYINDLDSIVSDISSITYTNHLTLDSILNIEALKAKTFGIKYMVKANIQSDINIRDVDLTTLLHNAIDNAIEASMEAKEKYVVITINVYTEYMSILIQNSYKALFGKVDYRTTKSDTTKHGWGISSMKKVVECYDGEFNISAENGINTLEIRLENNKDLLLQV